MREPDLPAATRHWPIVIGLLLVIVPFLAWLSRWFLLDLWYDEAFTLTNFVLVPLGTTLTDYSFPNNHVLFSLLSSLWLKLLGIGSVGPVLDHPWLLRVVPLLATFGTLAYLLLLGRKLFGRSLAPLPAAILVTTLPFLNFAVQVRGFSLSMLFCAALLFHAAAWLERGRWFHALLLALLTALALYTIPLNLYLVISLALVLALLSATRLIRRGMWTRPALGIGMLVAGVGLAALCYLPMLGQVVSNRYVASEGWFHFPTLYRTLPQILVHFSSLRWLLAVPFVAGIILLLRPRPSPASATGHSSFVIGPRSLVIGSFLLLILPFAVSCVRGDRPTLRVFVNLAPVFGLLVALPLAATINRVRALARRPGLALVVLVLYCQASLAVSVAYASHRLLQDARIGIQEQDISHNYYQFHYRPRALTRWFARDAYDGASPIITFDIDYAALPLYLEHAGLDHLDASYFRPALEQLNRFYVFTKFPNRFGVMLNREHPQFRHQRLNERIGFHNVFLLERLGER